MKINKSECVKIITTIKTQNPESLQYKNSSEFELLVDTWFDILKEYPQEIVWAAVRNALKNTIYQKQNWIGVICQEIERMKLANEKSDTQLWAELVSILDNVRRLTYFGLTPHLDNGKRIDPYREVQAVYDEMNPILKSYIGDIQELVALSKEETLEFEKGRFLKSVNQLRVQEKVKREMPKEFKSLILGLSDNMSFENKSQKQIKGR